MDIIYKNKEGNVTNYTKKKNFILIIILKLLT